MPPKRGIEDNITAAEIEEAVRAAMLSDSIRFAMTAMATEAATKAINTRLLDLSLGDDREAVEEFRSNMHFITNMRRRCEKVWDRVWSVGIGVVTAGAVVGAYSIAKIIFPGLKLLG